MIFTFELLEQMCIISAVGTKDATLRNSRVYVVDGRICLTIFNLKISVKKVGLDQVIFTWKILFNLVK